VQIYRSFDFVSVDQKAYLLEVPMLTIKELHFLDSQLPLQKKQRMKRQGIKREHAKSYSRIYRYFARFTEAEL